MGAVADKVDRLLSSLELDEAGEANAEIARALAAKLDEACESTSGSAAIATPGIAKELRAVIEEIRDSASDRGAFVTDLFS